MRRRRRSRVLVPVLAVAVSAALSAPVGRAAGPSSAPLAPLSPVVLPGLAKLSPVLRGLVGAGGYRDESFYRALPGHRPGDVYYLAELSRPADARIVRSLTTVGVRVRHRFRAIDWVALASPAPVMAVVARMPDVRRIEADKVQEVLAFDAQVVQGTPPPGVADQTKRGTSDVGADTLWAAGITGQGVTIGVADSGIDSTHPDLDDLDWRRWGPPAPAKMTAFADCTAVLPDLTGAGAPPLGLGCADVPGYDDNGHGTHVSGIAAGTAEGAGPDQHGRLPGIAPGAGLAGAKVCLPVGVCMNSSVMAGFEYLAMEREQGGAGADVVNASLGSGRVYGAPLNRAEQVGNNDPEAILVNRLARDHNVVFTISAGNSGPTLQSVGSPGIASQALGVGAAVTDFDRAAPVEATEHGEFGLIRPAAAPAGATAIANFSSRGPSGDRLVKPDVTAPGVYWVAAESVAGAEIRAADIAHRNAYSTDPTYTVISGTSMSAPAAAGAAALVIDGYRQMSAGATPRYHEVKAALANTAGTRAFEGAVTGLTSTIRAKVVPGNHPEKEFPNRNQDWVGVAGEGAGRIHAPSALLALTSGVIAFTPQQGELDDVHELQPSWSLDELAPGESATTTFVLQGGRHLPARSASVTFAVDTAPQPRSVHLAPASWFALPRPARVAPAGTTAVAPRLRVPANAAPGLYATTILARVNVGGGVVQTLRLPVQFTVPLTDPHPDAGRGTSVENDIWAAEDTDYSIVEAANPLGEIHTDWVTYPMRLAKGVTRVDLSVHDLAGGDHLDLFVFDDDGNEVDSSVSSITHHAVPGAVAYDATTREAPTRVSLLDGNDASSLALPTTIWIVVSDSGPAAGPAFSRFHLDVDVVSSGAAAATAAETVPAERVHSGTHAWWGGSSSGADSHLTRDLDLTAVPASAGAQLAFWTWYRLEDGYDWAFVLVSADGGRTWTSLATTAEGGSATTNLDPQGLVGLADAKKAYRDGLTGSSGHPPLFLGQNLGGPVYTRQVADLAPWAGKRVKLRFLYTSDGGTDFDGFYVDDVAVVNNAGAPLSVGGPNPDDAETRGAWTPGGAPGFRWVVGR